MSLKVMVAGEHARCVISSLLAFCEVQRLGVTEQSGAYPVARTVRGPVLRLAWHTVRQLY